MTFDVDDKELQKERLRGFLDGLAKLREDFGMEVGGCGECGSAWVNDLLEGEFVGEQIEWDEKTGDWRFSQGSILNEWKRAEPR